MIITRVKHKFFLIFGAVLVFLLMLEVVFRIAGSVLLSFQDGDNPVLLDKQDEFRIMCLGESTTAFGGRDSYPYQLQEILNGGNLGIKFKVINKGVAGVDTAFFLSKLDENLARYKPDMIITMLGTNQNDNSMKFEETMRFRIKLLVDEIRVYKMVRLISDRMRDKFHNRIRDKAARTPPKEAGAGVVPDSDRAYTEMGFAEKEQGRRIRALGHFKKAIRMDPSNSWARVGLAMVYKEMGRLDEAIGALRAAIEINPLSEAGNRELAWCLKKQKRYDEAGSIYQKIIKDIKPQNGFLYMEAGLFYKEIGRYPEAVSAFERGFELNPETENFYGDLAFCYEQAGKEDLAKRCYGKFNKSLYTIYNPATIYNYRQLRDRILEKGILLVCMQYPVRPVGPLRRILEGREGVIFVDNERVFKTAVARDGYEEYFYDNFRGDFGHCTRKGNRLLAENLADALEREYFRERTKI